MTENSASPDANSPDAKTRPARKRAKKRSKGRVSPPVLLAALAVPFFVALALSLLLLRPAPRSVAAAPHFEPHPALLDAVPSRRAQ